MKPKHSRTIEVAAISDPSRIGILGAGQIVSNVHLPVLKNLPNVEVAYIADIDAARGSRLARFADVPFVRLDLEDARLFTVDVLLLAIPWGARAPIYEKTRALGASQPGLYVEKPFARDLNEHQAILGDHAKASVAAGMQRRWLGSVQCARAMVRDELFGSLESINVQFGGLGRILSGDRYSSNVELAGGGILLEMGVHYIDAALLILGAESISLLRKNTVSDGGFDLHTEATLGITMGNGAFAEMEIEISNLKSLQNGITLVFEKATVRFDLNGETELAVKTHSGMKYAINANQQWGPNLPLALFAQQWTRYLEAKASGIANDANAETSILTTRVLEALHA